jgi:hypothetical protein
LSSLDDRELLARRGSAVWRRGVNRRGVDYHDRWALRERDRRVHRYADREQRKQDHGRQHLPLAEIGRQ